MGIGGISIWQLLIILAIVVMLFGTKRLRSLGGDLGEAIKGFRSSMSSEDQATKDEESNSESAQLNEQADKKE
jgi:sec-independent protein translocase protein TatA